MSRHMRSRRANTALPGYDNEGFQGHPAAYENPAVDEYGIDSDFGEEPHEGPYRSGPPPASYGWDPDHPAVKDTLVEDFGLRQAMERKAAKCIRIAERQLGRSASQSDIENLALQFMDLPNRSINTKLARFADDTVRQNARNVSVQSGPGNMHDDVVADFMADDLMADDLMADDLMADDLMADDLMADDLMAADFEADDILATKHRSHATKQDASEFSKLTWGENPDYTGSRGYQKSWRAKHKELKSKTADFEAMMADLEADDLTSNHIGNRAELVADILAYIEKPGKKINLPGNVSKTKHRSHATKEDAPNPVKSYYTNLYWGEADPALSSTGKLERWLEKNPDGLKSNKSAEDFESAWTAADVLAEEIETLKAANNRLARQVRKMADDAVAKGTGYSETEEELIEESVQPLKQASRMKSRGIDRLASALSGFFEGGKRAGHEAAEESVLASILAEVESDDQNDPKAFYSKSAEETSACGDVMGLDAKSADHGMDPKLARIFEAAKSEEESEEESEGESEGESEDIKMTEEDEEEEKPKAAKKSSDLRARQPAVKTLGNISRQASSVTDDLSKLWESAPDVSKYFGK